MKLIEKVGRDPVHYALRLIAIAAAVTLVLLAVGCAPRRIIVSGPCAVMQTEVGKAIQCAVGGRAIVE